MKLEDMNPDQLRSYVKELREENKLAREQMEVYAEVMKPFPAPQQRGLIHMIRTLGEDPTAGAQLFRDLSDNILGEEPKAEEDNDPKGEDDDMEIEPDDLKAAIAEAVKAALAEQSETMTAAQREAEEAEFQDQVAYWDAEAKRLGYEPNTPEAAELFFMANKLGTTDLEEAHAEVELLAEFRASREEEEGGGEEEEGEEEDKPKFPSRPKGGVGAPGVEGEEIDFSDDAAVRAATYRMLDSVDG